MSSEHRDLVHVSMSLPAEVNGTLGTRTIFLMTFPHVDMYIPNPGMVSCTEPCKLSPEGAGVLGERMEEGVVDDIANYLLQVSRRCSGLISLFFNSPEIMQLAVG